MVDQLKWAGKGLTELDTLISSIVSRSFLSLTSPLSISGGETDRLTSLGSSTSPFSAVALCYVYC